MKGGEEGKIASDWVLAKVRKSERGMWRGEGSTGHHGNPLKADPQCN